MTLQPCPDAAVAGWLVTAAATLAWERWVSFGPALPASVRLRFIPDPVRPGQPENEVDVGEDHPSDLAQGVHALHVLARFTATPSQCWVALWDGYSDLPLPPGAPRLELPHRSYGLFRGDLADVSHWLDGGSPVRPPAFVWPADRRWCFACDVDPHWAGIGADAAAVDALLAEPGLDVVPADPAAPQPTYY